MSLSTSLSSAPMREQSLTRRQLTALTGTTLAVAIAGCADDDEEEVPEPDDDQDDPEDPEEEPIEEPL